jgi:hypothetical protein
MMAVVVALLLVDAVAAVLARFFCMRDR